MRAPAASAPATEPTPIALVSAAYVVAVPCQVKSAKTAQLSVLKILLFSLIRNPGGIGGRRPITSPVTGLV